MILAQFDGEDLILYYIQTGMIKQYLTKIKFVLKKGKVKEIARNSRHLRAEKPFLLSRQCEMQNFKVLQPGV